MLDLSPPQSCTPPGAHKTALCIVPSSAPSPSPSPIWAYIPVQSHSSLAAAMTKPHLGLSWPHLHLPLLEPLISILTFICICGICRGSVGGGFPASGAVSFWGRAGEDSMSPGPEKLLGWASVAGISSYIFAVMDSYLFGPRQRQLGSDPVRASCLPPPQALSLP